MEITLNKENYNSDDEGKNAPVSKRTSKSKLFSK